MSRSFNGTTQIIRADKVIVPALPFSIVFDWTPASNAGNVWLFSASSVTTSDLRGYYVKSATANTIQAQAADSNATQSASSGTAITPGKRTITTAVFKSTTSRQCFNGYLADTEDTTSIVVSDSAPGKTAIGALVTGGFTGGFCPVSALYWLQIIGRAITFPEHLQIYKNMLDGKNYGFNPRHYSHISPSAYSFWEFAFSAANTTSAGLASPAWAWFQAMDGSPPLVPETNPILIFTRTISAPVSGGGPSGTGFMVPTPQPTNIRRSIRVIGY